MSYIFYLDPPSIVWHLFDAIPILLNRLSEMVITNTYNCVGFLLTTATIAVVHIQSKFFNASTSLCLHLTFNNGLILFFTSIDYFIRWCCCGKFGDRTHDEHYNGLFEKCYSRCGHGSDQNRWGKQR